jgi:hypothetical protein
MDFLEKQISVSKEQDPHREVGNRWSVHGIIIIFPLWIMNTPYPVHNNQILGCNRMKSIRPKYFLFLQSMLQRLPIRAVSQVVRDYVSLSNFTATDWRFGSCISVTRSFATSRLHLWAVSSRTSAYNTFSKEMGTEISLGCSKELWTPLCSPTPLPSNRDPMRFLTLKPIYPFTLVCDQWAESAGSGQ